MNAIKLITTLITCGILAISCNSSKKEDKTENVTTTKATEQNKDFSFKLPNDVLITSNSKDSVEYYVVNWLNNKNNKIDKTTWFNFDTLLFETDSVTIKPDSKNQLENIVAIMNAYPAVEIKLGAYTDSTEVTKDKQMKLSTDRALSVKDNLVKLGIDAKRIKSEGYANMHPVASNKTPEGRAENRRIAIRITKK